MWPIMGHWELVFVAVLSIVAGVCVYCAKEENRMPLSFFVFMFWFFIVGFGFGYDPDGVYHFADIFVRDDGTLPRWYPWFIGVFLSFPMDSCGIGAVAARLRKS